MLNNLAKLKKVDLRKVWVDETRDFTPWLSQEENLRLLSDEIGIELTLVQTEAGVGRYKVDILAKDESTDRYVIIENQMGDTDHDHLGKIITYASGYDAGIIIWIVSDIKEEHQKAIEWLNEHTDEKISFFLIKIELWQIGDSSPAPKFDVIVSPNEWAKTIKPVGSSTNELTDTKLQQLEFWTKFKNYVRKIDSKIRLQTPRPQHWYNVSMGSSDARISLTVNTRENEFGCEVYIGRNKDLFNYLHQNKDEIQKAIGDKIEWIDATIASRILIKKQVSDVFDQNQAENYYKWLYEKTILFQKVFGKYIKEYINLKNLNIKL